ncbi:Outer membrane protein TolC [Chitinophaga sp. YR573]|uniref:TolC family protein n=1 Tax=Chitinophaga sp. YR573 TaxID=1881040 RepID=UPI0008CB784F|nr:TolC family protein [Chitinophaga sp. YR573]SEW45683.1 Outer membrane protein TolC [Chitinophaga sp. YR573]
MKDNRRLNPLVKLFTVCYLLVITEESFAQQHHLSIKEVLSLVQTQQPELKGYKEQAVAAGYAVKVAQNTLIPEVTAGYQAGYATYNNITGMSYPGLILPISGPPSAGNTYDPVPGTALTALLKWNPVTFGQRQAAIEKAAAQYKSAASYYNDFLFRQQYAAIATYLDAIYLRKQLQNYQANKERTEAGLQQSLIYAQEGLRPGIDTTQFQAALAQVETDLLTIQQRYYAQLTELTRLTGLPDAPDNIQLSDTLLISQMPSTTDTTRSLLTHPLLQYYQTKKAVSEAALKEVQRAWRPRLDIWANAYARGSGIAADGSVNKSAGWSLTQKNYGAGIQLSFPLLQFSQVNIQKKQYQSIVKADDAQLTQVTLNLQKQQQTAQYNYRQNILIVRRAMVQSQAAQYAFDGLKLSYETGLIDFTRLIQGQYDLLKAEAGQAGAFLQLWHSLLDIAVANGNLDEFINSIK